MKDKQLEKLIKKAEWALDEERCDSNDAEHDALFELVQYLKATDPTGNPYEPTNYFDGKTGKVVKRA